jgi:chromosome segregation ATPase
MKNLIYLGLLVLVIAFFYPAKPGSTLHRFQGSIKSIGKSGADYRAELRNKQNELAAYEKVIDDITTEFERAVVNAPVCPITGQKAETTITEDPRDELREKCEALREEIRVLEEKLEG